MKKFIISLMAMFVATTIVAQIHSNGTQISAGYVNSKLTDQDPISAFKVGISQEAGLCGIGYGELFANVALEYIQKGYEFQTGKTKFHGTFNYLQAPVHLGYRIPLSSELNLLGEVGPYFAYGVGGTRKVTVADSDYSISNDSFCDDSPYNRFDVGVGAKVSLEFRNFIVLGAGYDHGLNQFYEYDDQLYLSCCYLTLGVKLFGR